MAKDQGYVVTMARFVCVFVGLAAMFFGGEHIMEGLGLLAFGVFVAHAALTG